MYKHLIFDCDGVIVDSEIVATRVSLRLLAPFGYAADEATHAQKYAGLKEADILQRLQTEEGLSLPTDFWADLVSAVEKAMYEELVPISGMPEFIRSLPKTLSVASNSGLTHVTRALEIAGVRPWIGDRMYSAEQVPQPKPYPDVYLLALQRQGFDAAQSLVVEDSTAGVTAAKAAGCTVIGFLGASHIFGGHEQKLLTAGADFIAKDAEELKAIISGQLTQ